MQSFGHLPATANQANTFEAYLDPILAVAFKTALYLTRHREDAEDLVQEAVVRAFRAFDTFETGTNFKAWFLRIQHNCFLGKLRQANRRPQTVAVGNDETLDNLFLFEQTRRAGWDDGSEHSLGGDPAALLLAKLDAGQIGAALCALPDEFRAVATLYFLHELSYEQIAHIVDCPINTVRSRLHRSRKLLQKALWEVALERGWKPDEPDAGKKAGEGRPSPGLGLFFW